MLVKTPCPPSNQDCGVLGLCKPLWPGSAHQALPWLSCLQTALEVEQTKPRQQLLGGHGGLGQVMTQQRPSPWMWGPSYGHLTYLQEFRGSPLGSLVRACLRVAPSVDRGLLPPPPGQRKDRP